MEEKTLLKLSLLVTLGGLLFLFFYSQEVELEVSTEISETPAQEIVKVRGVVKTLTAKEKVLFLQVINEKEEEFSVVLFPEEELFLKVGDYVQITGAVEDYQGKKEILANEIILVG